MSGFTATCQAQSKSGFRAAGDVLKHSQGKHHAVNLGCLIFAPFITIFVWAMQFLILFAIAAPALAWGIVFGLLAGCGAIVDSVQRKPA